MEVRDAMQCRKSVRSYTGEKISEAELSEILAAAQAAPVGRGLYDTVRMTVIQDPALLGEIDANARKAFQSDSPVLYGAPTLVLVSTKVSGTKADNVAYSNAACLVENMALAAVGLGVGACHIWGATGALAANQELTAKLGLPEGFTPVCGIALGKTTETYEKREIPTDRIAVDTIG